MRIAVVGLGYWGPNFIRVLSQMSDVELVAICDQDAKRRELPTPYPVVRYSDFDQMLTNPQIDAVVIATSISTHYELASKALQASKHVFVEKPLATSIHEANLLLALAKDRGKLLMPGHTFLYSPAVNQIKHYISENQLGEIKFVSMNRLNSSVHTTEADVLWDLGPHDFSILRYWFPSFWPTEMKCTADSYTAIMSMMFDKTIASVTLTWQSPIRARSTIIVGTEGMVVYDDTAERPVTFFEKGGSTFTPALSTKEPLLDEMEDFVRAIRRNTYLAPRSNAILGIDVVKMVSMAQDAKDDRARAHGFS